MFLDPPSQSLSFLIGTVRGTGKHTVIKEAWEHSWYLKNPAQPLWTVPTPVFSIPLTKSASTLEAGLKPELSRGGKLQTSGPTFLQNPVSHVRGSRVPHHLVPLSELFQAQNFDFVFLRFGQKAAF